MAKIGINGRVIRSRLDPKEKRQPEPVSECPPLPAELRRPGVIRVLREVGERHNLHPVQIAHRSRVVEVVQARQEVFYRLNSEGYSKSQIGRLFGFDHTTVLHGVTRHAERTGGQA